MLNTTQKSALTALKFKPLSVTAMAKQMTVAKVLAESLANQLVELGLATKYDNGQFTVSPKGKDYLAGKLGDAATAKAQPDTAKHQPTEQVAVNKPTAEMTCISEYKDPVLAEVPKDSLEALLRDSAAETVEETAVIPEPVTAALLNLEQRLNRKIPAPVKLELKLAVLHRLALLMDPSISEVLEQISDDLTTLQQSAAA